MPPIQFRHRAMLLASFARSVVTNSATAQCLFLPMLSTHIRKYSIAVVVSLLSTVLSTQLAASEPAPLVKTDGSIEDVKLVSLSDNVATFLDAESVQSSMPLEHVVRWGSLSTKEQMHQVVLSDGSILVGLLTQLSRNSVVLESDVFGELTLPFELISHVIWRLPADELPRTKLRDTLRNLSDADNERTAGERLYLRSRDTRTGRLVQGSSSLLTFQTQTSTVELKPESLAAWYRAEVEESTGHVVGFRDGTRLVVSRLRTDSRLEADLVCGLHLGTLPEIRPLDESLIVFFRPHNKNIQYLSQLSDLGHKHIPFLASSWTWGRDRNVLGGRISSPKRVFDKGIGMHSTSRLAFDLPVGFDEFQAEVCLDRSAGTRGSVQFRVFTSKDGAKWSPAHKTQIVRGGDPIVPLRVRTAGMRRLALVVDFAERGDELDRANWIGARLVRESKQ